LLQPATSFGEHAHDIATLTLTLAGEYEEEFESGRQSCGPLSVQLKPCAVPHTTDADRGASLFIVHLHPDALEQSGIGRPSRPFLMRTGVASALALGCREAALSATAERAVIEPRLRALLRYIARQQSPACPPEHWIQAVVRRIDDELVDPPRLAELAAAAGVHPVYLARVFRRTFGCSVSDWIRSARTDRAVLALANTTRDVMSIALGLGYYDQSHLGRDFRRETGWSPARFRNAAKLAARRIRSRERTRVLQNSVPA